MTEQQLRAIVKGYVDNSTLYADNALSGQQQKAYEYYYGELPSKPSTKGRSSVVSRDVADAVDWMMPSLMRIFQGDKDVVRLCPQSEEDIKQAKQEQQYMNYVFNRQNNGYRLTFDFIQDALLNKNGIFKTTYQEKRCKVFADYSGLNQEQIQLLLAKNPNTEVVSQMELEVDTETQTYDVRMSMTRIEKKQCVECLPNEEFIVDSNATELEDAAFLAHRKAMSRDEAIALGFNRDTVMSLTAADRSATVENNSVYQARNAFDSSNQWGGSNSTNKLQELVWIIEAYVKVDYDGDGYSELRQIFTGEQGEILSNELCDEHPFSTASPFRIAHKLYGMSMYDVLKEVQDIKTSLLRNLLDNMYNLNNGRYEVVEGMANLDDLMNNKLGGAVRVKQAGMIKPLAQPALPTHNFEMLNYFDQIRTDRSGVSERSKGLDSNTLHSNQAASSVWATMGAAEQRIELIARMLAEGFRSMFTKLRNNIIRHQDSQAMMELNNGEFVSVDPRTWNANRDVIISSGLGNDNKEQRMQYMQQIINTTQAVVSAGGKDILVSDDNIYRQLIEFTKLAGFDSAEEYWNNPSNQLAAQTKQAKAEAAKKPKPEDINAQAKMMDSQTAQMKAQHEAKFKQQELEIDARTVSVKEAELPIKQEANTIAREKNQVDIAAVIAETMLEKKQNRNVEIGNDG